MPQVKSTFLIHADKKKKEQLLFRGPKGPWNVVSFPMILWSIICIRSLVEPRKWADLERNFFVERPDDGKSSFPHSDDGGVSGK